MLVNVEGGWRVWGQVFAGRRLHRRVELDRRGDRASIPNPIFFDQPRAASLQAEFDHRERAVHLFARYILPINEDFEIGFSAGPSFISVSHELVTGITFDEGAAPFTTVVLTGASTRKESETAATLNIGANVTYRLTRTSASTVSSATPGAASTWPARPATWKSRQAAPRSASACVTASGPRA